MTLPKILFTLLCSVCIWPTYAGYAPKEKSVVLEKPAASREGLIFRPAQMAFQLVTPEEEFESLGLLPEELSRYLAEIVSVFEHHFVSLEPGVVAVAFEINAITPPKDTNCLTDHTKCTKVQFFIQPDEKANVQSVKGFAEELKKIKEVKITNFASTAKAAFIIYIKP